MTLTKEDTKVQKLILNVGTEEDIQAAISVGEIGQNELSIITNKSDCKRNVGEIIEAALPLTDAGLHLLDGSLLAGGGIYDDFVTYVAGLVSTYPDCFTTEAAWQQSVTDYGVCGKFVYDSVNNTVRLPKITGIVEGTTDLTALGDLVEAGCPNITGSWGDQSGGNGAIPKTGAFSGSVGSKGSAGWGTSAGSVSTVDFNASNSNPIYGNSTTVQPQTIKALYYIVVAASIKTDVEVDIDNIATDLNGKADRDLSNITASRSFFSGYAFSVEQASVTVNNYYTLDLPETINPQNYYVKAYAVFTSAGGGYSVDDIVPFECLWGTNYRSLTFWYNSTQVGFVTSDQVSCCQKGTSNTGVSVQSYIKVIFDFYKLR